MKTIKHLHVVVVACLALFFCAGDGSCFLQANEPVNVQAEAKSPDDLAEVQRRLMASTAKALASTVGMRVNRSVVGSGVVVSSDGLVLTAGHVTSEAGLDVEFWFPDGKRARGKTLGVCKWADAGMAKITDPGPWPHSPMAEANRFAVDDWVFAFGHPLGLIVNRPPPLRFGRIMQLQPDTVHSDCCIVVGDSGGPLFDLDGNVIGINSRISGIDERPDLTYHVSINVFREYYDRLLAGEVWETDASGRRGEALNGQLHEAVKTVLPITVRICSETTQQRNVRGGNQRQQRRQVQRQVSYENLALGVIVDSNGLIATKASEIGKRQNLVCMLNANDREERHAAKMIGIDRGNDIALLKIEKNGLPAIDWSSETLWSSEKLSIGTLIVTPVPGGSPPMLLGAVSIARRSIPSEHIALGVSVAGDGQGNGARILQTMPRSPAAAAGLRQNDIIVQVNETQIEHGMALADSLEAIKPGEEIQLTYRREDQTLQAVVKAVAVPEAAERRNAMNKSGFGISRVHDGFALVMQHDTVVRPTDCGGPLVTLDGKLVGINIARGGRTESYAVPIAKFRQIVETLQNKIETSAGEMPEQQPETQSVATEVVLSGEGGKNQGH